MKIFTPVETMNIFVSSKIKKSEEYPTSQEYRDDRANLMLEHLASVTEVEECIKHIGREHVENMLKRYEHDPEALKAVYEYLNLPMYRATSGTLSWGKTVISYKKGGPLFGKTSS